eukprot:1277735-Prymnesium_polylepis.1
MAIGIVLILTVIKGVNPGVGLGALTLAWFQLTPSEPHAHINHPKRLARLQTIQDALRILEAAPAIACMVERHLRLLKVGVGQILPITNLSDDMSAQLELRRLEESGHARHEGSAVIVVGTIRLHRALREVWPGVLELVDGGAPHLTQ